MKQHDLGKWGEQLAHQFLTTKGYVILFRNWRSKKAEVDLIAFYKNRIILVEVKTRSNTLYGEPIQSISNKKIELLRQAAEDFLNQYNLENEIQIDVFGIDGDERAYQIEWISDAIGF
ncbi:MAG: YraN family protein [Flavobacteriales bacterium]